ncbi:MAG: hypothetical protein ACI83B_001640 [Sediminicola sp.]|jgi:hypothetical protein
MKVLILGASNELGNTGYVGELSKQGCLIRNLSIGGCGSSAGILNLIKYDFPKADCAILSYEINEQSTLQLKLRTEAEIRENWEWLFSQLRRRNITPVLVILPRVTKGLLWKTECRDLQRQIAIDNDVHFFDFTDTIDKALSFGANLPELMRDNSHMSTETSRIMGDLLHVTLKKLLDSDSTVKPEKTVLPDFHLIKAVDLVPASRQRERKTSVLESRLAVIDSDCVPVFPINDDEAITAISLNRLAGGGNVRLGTPQKAIVKRFTFWTEKFSSHEFMSLVCDLRPFYGNTQNKVILNICDENEPATEQTLHSVKPVTDRYGEIELEAFLVRNKEPIKESFDHLRKNDFPLDLSLSFDELTVIKELKSICIF